MSKYHFKYDLPKREAAPSGSRYSKTYHMEIDKNGHKELIEDGLTDNYEKIQSYLESTLIENIMARAMMGDLSGLNAKEPQYMDCRDMPSTLAEAQNLISKIEAEFANLPIAIRENFNHSVTEYVASYGTEEWEKIMGIMDTSAPISADTPKESEEKAE